MLCCQVEESFPQISLDFSHQIFQMSLKFHPKLSQHTSAGMATQKFRPSKPRTKRIKSYRHYAGISLRSEKLQKESSPNFSNSRPELFEDFSCFISWETETTINSPKIPTIFQCHIPRQTQPKQPQKVFWRAAKVNIPWECSHSSCTKKFALIIRPLP